MADLRVVCPGCKRRFRPPKATRRRYCETCRPPRSRAADDPPAAAVLRASEGPGDLEAAARAQLESVGRHETVQGVLVLALARDIDTGAVTPAQKGGAGEKLVKLLVEALKGTTPPRAADRLDELEQRRIEKARAAS